LDRFLIQFFGFFHLYRLDFHGISAVPAGPGAAFTPVKNVTQTFRKGNESGVEASGGREMIIGG
jgi:hypothetical protein